MHTWDSKTLHHMTSLFHSFSYLGLVTSLSLSFFTCQFSSVAQSCPTLQPHGLQHARLPCPSPTPGAYSNSYRWCHPTISTSVVPFSFCLQSSQHQGLFQGVSSSHQVGRSIGASTSASVLPMNIQDWFPLGLTGLISLQSKGLLRITWIFQLKGKYYSTG